MLFDETTERLGELDRVEVLALHVLDERELEGDVGRDVLHDDHHFTEARLLRCAPPSLAGDDLEAVLTGRGATYDDGLQDSVLADRGGELLEGLGVEVLARLPLLRNELLERAHEDRTLGCARAGDSGGRRRDGEESVEPAPESALFGILVADAGRQRAPPAAGTGTLVDRSSFASER